MQEKKKSKQSRGNERSYGITLISKKLWLKYDIQKIKYIILSDLSRSV